MPALDREEGTFGAEPWLEEAARLLGTASGVDEVAEILVHEVADLVGACAAFVAFREGEEVSIHRRRGFPVRLGIWNRFALDAPVPAAEAVRLGRPVWAERRADLRDRYPRLARHSPFRSFFAQPLVGTAPPAGVLVFSWRAERSFPPIFREGLRRLAAEVEDALGRAGFDPSGSPAARVEPGRERDGARTAGAFIAHEMRNYLNAMQLHLDLLALRTDRSAVVSLERCVQGLARLADDVASLPSPEWVPLRLSLEDLELDGFLAEVCERSAPLVREASAELRCDATGQLPVLRADPDRLREVMDNLLINAVRHTPPGGRITVDAEALDESVVVSVVDTGSGIPPGDVERIFEPYWREEGSPGDGLGLAIARAIVTAHGGRIWAVSEPGEGTGLFFSLPISDPDLDRTARGGGSAEPDPPV